MSDSQILLKSSVVYFYHGTFVHFYKIFFLLVFIVSTTKIKAQTQDTLMNKFSLKEYILPSTLIISGVLINDSEFEQNIQSRLRNKVGNDFEFRIDDYIQYAPIAEMYIADAINIQAKNHWFDQTKYLLISNIISSTITHVLKRTMNKTRPNSSPYSFPSGHTTFSFTNATVLFNEFKETSPLLAYSGYAFSTTTGAFRMINNKHWLSDVLVGAGIGIAVTNLVYYFEPFKNFNPFKHSKNNITCIPVVNNNNYGVYISYSFK